MTSQNVLMESGDSQQKTNVVMAVSTAARRVPFISTDCMPSCRRLNRM